MSHKQHTHITTYTGKELDLFHLKKSDICIEDIAHALALCNRFAGHTKKPISVAQHSVYTSRLCINSRIEIQLQALLHDGAEAYIGDVTKWIKQTPPFEMFRSIEHDIEKLIFNVFGCPHGMRQEVELADRIMVCFEGKKGFGNSFKIDHPDYPELTIDELARIGKWGFWTWRQAEESFLDHFRMLTGVDVDV